MAQALDGGHDAEIERVASVVGKSADTALAKHYVVIAFAHDVFGGHQELFERGGNPSLQQNRFARASGTLQQREVLHVAGADLNHVGVLLDQIEGLVVHGFGDDQQAKAVAEVGHNLQTFFAESLKGIGRSTRLVCAATEKLGAGAGHAIGDLEGLVAALDAAWTGHNDKICAADGDRRTRKPDYRVIGLYVATYEFV